MGASPRDELVANWELAQRLEALVPIDSLPLALKPMLAVTTVTPLEDHVLRLEFSDGAVGDVDCAFLVGKGLGAELRAPAIFRGVRVDDELRTVVWPNGLDPALELLRDRLASVQVTPAAA